MFIHRYALKVGWPVGLLLKSMSSSELSEAIAYSRLEPYGEWKSDYLVAKLCSVIATCTVGGKGRSFQPSDFMPDYTGKSKSTKIIDDIKEAFNLGDIS